MALPFAVMLVCLPTLIRGQLNNDSINWRLKLHNDMMTNYESSVIPRRTKQQQVTAVLRFSLGRIESLVNVFHLLTEGETTNQRVNGILHFQGIFHCLQDEKAQVLTSYGWMHLQWNDDILRWDPAEYDGIDSMILHGHQAWIPEISVLNTVDHGADLALDSDFRIHVNNTGVTYWIPAMKWRTSCKVYLRYFPFDTQICEVQFITWMYESALLNITYGTSEVDLSFYVSNEEWELVSTKVGAANRVSAYVTLPIVAFQLRLRRQPSYFVLNLVIPALIMSVMSLLVFSLPPESGEKISLGITILLSYVMLLLMMSDITPRSSETLPVLTVYIVVGMGLSALALFCTVLVLNIHHHSPDKPVPTWIRVLVLERLAFFLCVRKSEHTAKSCSHGTQAWTMNSSSPTHSPDAEMDQRKCKSNGGKVAPGNVIDFSGKTVHNKENKAAADTITEKKLLDIARVMDRLFLILYIIIIVTAIGVMLGITSGDEDSNGIDTSQFIV